MKTPKLAKGQFAFLNCRTLDADAVLALDRTHQEQFMEQIHAYCGVREQTIAKTLEAFLESEGLEPSNFSIELWDVYEGGVRRRASSTWSRTPVTARSSTMAPRTRLTASASCSRFESHGSDEPKAPVVDALQAAADKTSGL